MAKGNFKRLVAIALLAFALAGLTFAMKPTSIAHAGLAFGWADEPWGWKDEELLDLLDEDDDFASGGCASSHVAGRQVATGLPACALALGAACVVVRGTKMQRQGHGRTAAS